MKLTPHSNGSGEVSSLPTRVYIKRRGVEILDDTTNDRRSRGRKREWEAKAGRDDCRKYREKAIQVGEKSESEEDEEGGEEEGTGEM